MLTRKMRYPILIQLVVVYVYNEFRALTYGNPVIQPSPIVTVIEGANATFNCTYQHSENEQFILNVYKEATEKAGIYIIYAFGCNVIGQPLSNVVCNDIGNTMTITIVLNYELYEHKQTWFCGLSQQNPFANTTLFINVPVTDTKVIPTTNGTIYIIERVPFEFRCQSRGRPAPVIEWYKQTVDGPEIPLETGVRDSTNLDDPEIESVLEFVSSTDDNGYRIYCKAYNNISDTKVISLNKPLLNVLFPPTIPTIKYIQSNGGEITVQNITVLAGQNATFKCYSDSNPASTYAWSPGQLAGESIEIVVKQDTTEITCLATNEMNSTNGNQQSGTNSSSTGVTVLYPPTTPTLTYTATKNNITTSHTINTAIVDVVSGDTFSIECTVDGNPVPVYNWSHPLNSIQTGSNLFIENIQPEDNNTYTCTASNVMNPTYGANVSSSSFVNVTFNVMYSPILPTIKYIHSNGSEVTVQNIRVFVGQNATFKCNSDSNPASTYAWSPGQLAGQSVEVVVKQDTTELTCIATNEMNPTKGDQQIGTNSSSISVNILYPPTTPILAYIATRIGNTTSHTITSPIVDVVSGDTFSIECTAGGYPFPVYNWSHPLNFIQTDSKLFFENIQPDNNHTYTCTASNIMNPTYGTNMSSSSYVNVSFNVMYPPTIPTIKYIQSNGSEETVLHISVIEGQNATFNCSIDSNPASTYAWSPGQLAGQSIEIVVNQDTTEVTCIATNEMKPTNGDQQIGVNSASISVAVLYPPTTSYLTYTAANNSIQTSHSINTAVIAVVSGDTFSIDCTADSNPVSIYNWTDQLNSYPTDSRLSIDNIQSDNNKTYSCTASNVMNPTYGANVSSSSSVNVSFNVLYGPSMPTIYYGDASQWKPILTTLVVIEQTNFNVKCNDSTSNPQEKRYQWQGQTGKTLTINNISRNDTLTYTCDVKNIMFRSFGDKEYGRSSTTMTVDVLYPPSIKYLEDIKLEEGAMLNVTCAVTKGNSHSNNMFRWSNTFGILSSTQTLEIHAVTRNHAGQYTCFVHNTLIPTFGKAENGSDSETFYLEVLYKTSIKQFYAEKDDITYSNVTINETDQFYIFCSVDSHPTSNIDIRRDGQQIAVDSNVKNISHFMKSAACDDSGVYTCTGYNPRITETIYDSRSLSVYVLCYPRVAEPVNSITAVALNTTAHFNITFVAYQVPRNENYVWRKQLKNGSWIKQITNDKISIATRHLQTELTIYNVNMEDYGNYSLTVSNNGSKDYHQVFKVLPQGPPIKASNFHAVVENKDVTISWLPGFNGGFDQTFVIQLKADVQSWYNVSFDIRNDSSNQFVVAVLSGLDFDTTYNIRMFAYNVLGRSNYVPDPPYKVFIRSEPISPKSPLVNIAAIVSGIIGGVIVVVIVVACVVFIRRKSVPKTGKVKGAPGQATSGITGSTGPPHKYEDIDLLQIENNTYCDLTQNGPANEASGQATNGKNGSTDKPQMYENVIMPQIAENEEYDDADWAGSNGKHETYENLKLNRQSKL